MIVRPVITQLAGVKAAVPNAPQRLKAREGAGSRVRLNLQIKRLNVDGLAPSERGIFLAAFESRINTLARDAVRRELWPQAVQKRRRVLRHIDGGVLPPRVSAKSMGERAATAILREILR